jgi:hypothetical protein
LIGALLWKPGILQTHHSLLFVCVHAFFNVLMGNGPNPVLLPPNVDPLLGSVIYNGPMTKWQLEPDSTHAEFVGPYCIKNLFYELICILTKIDLISSFFYYKK